jgi:hypothetical protein
MDLNIDITVIITFAEYSYQGTNYRRLFYCVSLLFQSSTISTVIAQGISVSTS